MKVLVSILFALLIQLPDTEANSVAGTFSRGSNRGNVARYMHDPASSSNLSSSFLRWLSCYQSQSPECVSCRQETIRNSSVDPLAADIAKSCLPFPSEREYLFSGQLSANQMTDRDNRICNCLEGGGGSQFEKSSFNEGSASEDQLRMLRSESNLEFERMYGEELSSRLSTERLQSTFSAISYIDDSTDAMRLATKYGKVGTSVDAAAAANEGAALATSTRILMSQRQDQWAQKTNNERITPERFNTDPMPQGYCLPYRHFIAHKQFPTSLDFYDGLSRMNSGYQDRDWNYRSVMTELHRLVGNNIGFEERIRANPRAQQLLEQADFLHNNPVVKNIFLSDDQTTKDQLFQIISRMPRLQCTNGDCRRGDQWITGMESYRREMAGFLATAPAIDAARNGSVVSGRLSVEVANVEARQQSQASQSVLDTDRIADPAMWVGFCASRDQNTAINQGMEFILDVEDGFGIRNFADVEEDGDFERLNGDLCSGKRKNPSNNREESFDDFFRRECPTQTSSRCSIETRGTLIGMFLDAYSVPVDLVDDSTIEYIRPFLGGRISGPASISRRDAEEFNNGNRDPVRSRGPVVFTSAEYANLTPASQGNASRSPVISRTPASSSSSVASSTTNLADISQSSFAAQNDNIFVPSQPISNVAPAQATETLRSALTGSEAETQEIRNEISSLREVIREPASSRDPQALLSLTERLSSLERRLSEKERENSDLREQLADAEDDREAAPQRAQNQPSSNDSRRSSGSSQQNQATVSSQSQGGVSGGAAIGPSSVGGQASLGRISAGSSAIQRVASGSNSALLSKYGVRETSEQGAITVAASSSSIDYQSLRTQSENSIIPIAVSAAEFDQIAGNNQEALSRYLDQVKAMPGEVVRLNLTAGSDRTMELFVVKNGNEISIVQAQSPDRSIASDSPEVIREASREVTLDSLRNELGR